MYYFANFHNTLFLFQLDLDFLEQHATSFFKEDIVVGDRRHLLFYTDNQLDLLGKAKIWYMDGTFRVVKDPFQQLFSINAFVQSGDNMKQIPLVFVIMSGKSTEDYYQVCIYFEHSIVTYCTEENDRGLKIIGSVEQKKICIDVPWYELIKINK